MKLSLISIILFFLSIVAIKAQDIKKKPSSIAYQWKNVEIVGGGFVDGIVFHPKEKGLCYARTDMGGAYRRNANTMRWEPLLDWISYEDVNLMGVESIALDPNDPDWVFLSCGTYTLPHVPDGAILRSSDRGKTFLRSNVPFKMGGNENGRGNGERLAVDPDNGNILYVGTRNNGLWKSTDRAARWNRVDNFPDVTEYPPASLKDENEIRRWEWQSKGCGIIFVLFDPQSGSSGKTSSAIYVGVSLMNRDNLFRSTDAGKTWHAVPGQPKQYRPTHAVLAEDGMMYITYGDTPGPSRMTTGGVWKLNTKTDEWIEITPDKPDPKTRPFGYAAVSVDAQNPKTLIVSSFNRYQIDTGEEIFRSLDGGISWEKVFDKGIIRDSSLAPYTSRTGIHWLFDIEIDPFDSDHIIFTTGYGGHETFELTNIDKNIPTTWHVMSSGIEETVALELLSPPKGAHIITAIGDYGGFVHRDLDKPAPEGSFTNPSFGNTNGVACAENNPDLIARVGRAWNQNPNKHIGYSLDGGRTWQPTDTIPDPNALLGHIAVSADGETWIWAPDPVRRWNAGGQNFKLLPVYITSDRGKTWNECKGIPGYTRVVADKVNPKKFYGFDLFAGKLFISSDGGFSFNESSLNLPNGIPQSRENRGDNRGGQDRIYAAPGYEGDLWIAAFDGLYHSKDEGNTFVQMSGVSEIHGFGFGKEAPGTIYPSLYLIGVVNGVRGIYHSDDIAESWIRINDDQHQWGMLFHITGDPKIYGRVYVGTHGRGTLYGDPVN